MKVIKPPDSIDIIPNTKAVFLAGSIDMGNAINWQVTVTQALADSPVTFLNPRRDDWDASWEQSTNNPQFVAQVNWELEALEKAHYIAMYFAPHSKAPITLLELGLFAQSKKLIVCCSKNFWRKGNVDVVCQRYDIPQVTNLENLIQAIKKECVEI
ncbi:nucleoside 2-deoxyribosyltransferase domain-containing protein [Microscilla marina]|uniref:Nucleoside 2-deoxyribosyltransferase like n=1 Tax=Microscilla marina ATCC 23134 TaxID=313606 RepID=A1ZTR0_MICM2|nr:nucleoside 2-deoxyribosyltransferase domain-containing protein [Microscilla marina]EAY26162.1 hypothetical protein M23134_02494 [Microscilla marina ATCC 23134]